MFTKIFGQFYISRTYRFTGVWNYDLAAISDSSPQIVHHFPSLLTSPLHSFVLKTTGDTENSQLNATSFTCALFFANI
jgi:hypothetical protein